MPTTNPVPSTDPTDLLFNAGKLDEVVNGAANSFTDRLGVARRTVAGMNADFDAQLADAESDLNVYRADAAASAAEALGYLQTIRTTSYGAYASDPATDPLGNPPTVGDEYFNTTSNLVKRWNGTTWQASDINTANLAAPSGSSLVGYLPSGTGAVATTVQSKLRETVSVFDFMTPAQVLAIRSGTYTDATSSINLAFQSGASKVVLGRHTFNITDNVTVPDGVSVDFDGGELLYSGPRDRVAFQVGTTNGNAGPVSIQGIKVRSSVFDWSNTSYIGVRVCSARRANINVVLSSGFAIGYEAYSKGGGYAYNYHLIQHLQDNKYAMALTNDGASSYVNENVFMGGRYGNTSATNAFGSSFGVWVRVLNDGYRNSNLNRWIAPCFELQMGYVSDTRMPFFFDNCGRDNTVINARYETGRGSFALLDGTTYDYVANNRFEARVFGSGSLRGITQTGTARQNFFYDRSTPQDSYPGSSISYDVFKAVKAYNATNSAISDGLHFGTSSSATPLSNIGSITQRRNSVSLPSSRTIGFFSKTTPGGCYSVTTESDISGGSGRIIINCYDANFRLLTNASSTYPDLLSEIDGSPVSYTEYYGGGYSDNVDGNSFFFQLSNAVHYIRVSVAGATNDAWLKAIRLQQLDQARVPIRCFSGLDSNDADTFAGASPNTGVHGSYARGQIIHNAVAASGQPSYWQCTTAGRLAPAWAPSTAYVVGAVALNDTDKIYACVTAGTSAGSGGPTGTGTAITDGTAVWDYISPKAIFLSGANLT